MIVSESTGVHERPTKSGLGHAAIVTDEATATTLCSKRERERERERENHLDDGDKATISQVKQ